MSDTTNQPNDDTQENSVSRRDFFKVSAAAGMGVALAGLFMSPSAAFASPNQQTSFGPKRKLIWVPQAAGDWEIPARVGFIDFCKMVGWDYQYLGNPVYSVENHLEQLNNAIAAKPDVIVTQLENVGLVSGFQKAISNKIAMVVANQALYTETGKLGLNYIGENGVAAGYQNGTQVATWAQKLTNKKEGVVLIGSGNPGAAAIDDRQHGTEQGVADYNKANGTNYTTKMFPDSAFDDLTTSIQKWGAQVDQVGDKLVGMVGLGGPSGVSIWKVMTDRNIAPGTYAAGCHDATDDQLTAIEQGYEQWGIDQNVYLQGLLSAVSGWYQLERGVPYRNVDTSGEVVHKEDLAIVRNRSAIYAAKAKEYGVAAQ